jgi:hypothetical protein
LGHDAPGVLDECSEQGVFLATECDRDAVQVHFTAREIDMQMAIIEQRQGLATHGMRAQQCAHARHQFLHAEGFGDVVVGAGIQRCNFLAFAVAYRQQDHWARSTRCATRATHRGRHDRADLDRG